MIDQDTSSAIPTEKPILPRIQTVLLWILILGYPVMSLVFNFTNPASSQEISSRITQVYLPAISMQILLLAAVWIVLRRSGGSFDDMGFNRENISWPNIVSGAVFFVGAWSLMIILKTSMERSGLLPGTELENILPVTSGEKLFWIVLSAGAALSEEIAFRGYVISRIKIITGRYWIGAVLGSAAFSLGHLYQGMGGVILVFIYGLLFSMLYIARKSVVPCITAHFLQDAIILAAVFFA